MSDWMVEFRGGAFDEWEVEWSSDKLVPLLVVWACEQHETCAHVTSNPEHPGIVLRTAEVYCRAEVDLDQRRAFYDVGEGDPNVDADERELVGAGMGELPPPIDWGLS